MSGGEGRDRPPDSPSAQLWDPDRYARNARFVAELGAPAVDLLAPLPGERILDIGCGDGALTEKLAAMGVDVVGIDSSAEQIVAARGRGLNARVMDGQSLDLGGETFDAVFSNAALHWMPDIDAVIAGVRRVLRPGGRFVAEMGGAGNVGAIRAALHAALAARGIDAAGRNPWVFPTPEDYRARLEAHGFAVRAIDLIPRPTPLPGEMVDWLETFTEDFLAAVPEDGRAALLAEISAALAPTQRDADGKWTADYVRLRFAADLPGG